MKMGMGIAEQFLGIFGNQQYLLQQNAKVGEVALLKNRGRYVYYLVTKKKYNSKPTYNTLKRSLYKMKAHAEAQGVTTISMPKIGCGLDNLKWKFVFPLIKQVFANTDININIFYLKL